ncbi:MAG: aspartate kinase [Euryarchaeota archaeon]|nr:aspartate kinase [Euryarchaeota archaeon]
MKVMKFGGSSVASGRLMRQVAGIVEAHATARPLVVTSAMQGVTDAIEAHLRTSPHDEAGIPVLVDAVTEKHKTAAREGVRDPHLQGGAVYQVNKIMERLERLLYGIAYIEELTPKARDFAVSFGERLAAPILSATIADRGIDSRAFDAEQVGILTDGSYGNATPRLPDIERRFQEVLAPYIGEGGVPVVTGFYGVDAQGHPTIFGRGGSDYVAAILAYAGDAEGLEIWKDVPGFMTTDPNIVPEAHPLREMSYDEAAELANFGAKVLHPRTVEPVALKGIPIRVLNTMEPEAPGTLIHHIERVEKVMMRAVAARGALAIVKLIGPGMAYTKGIGERVFTILNRARVNVINMAASQASFALLIDAADLDRAMAALEEVKGGVIQDTQALRDMALLCVVGKGLSETPGSAAKILSVISDVDVNIEMISLGASDIAIDVIVHAADRDKAVKAVHDAFLKGTTEKVARGAAASVPGRQTS